MTVAPAAGPKVLHVTVRSDRSGGPRYVAALLDGLRPDVVNLVAAPPDGELAAAMRALVGDDQFLALPERSFSLAAFARLLRFIRARGVDILHSHGRGGGVYARLAGLLTRTPVVHTFHGVHLDPAAPAHRLPLLIERLLDRVTRVSVCVGEQERAKALAARIAGRRKLVTIKSGVAVSPRPRPRAGGGAAARRLLHYSRFDVQKNFDELIAVAERLDRALDGDWRIEVIGDGERRAAYAAEAARRGLADRIVFCGSVTDSIARLAQSDLLIVTSRWEGLPLIVLEAMALGVPVVASAVVGNTDLVVDGWSGRTYPLGDPAEACAAVVETLTMDRGAHYALNGQVMLKRRYSYDRMLRAHLRLYALLGRREREPFTRVGV